MEARQGTMLYTVREVSEACGISIPRVHQVKAKLGIGRKIGRDWLFTIDDIQRVKQRNTHPGRPRQSQEG